ncbi:MAG: putative Glycosyl transferase, group 1 [Nitrospira sp.]|nr:putative Glycosyl transferase, group 1 [Nitrospira sp.]
MNILHLSTEYNLGGSGRAAYRIHAGLLQLQYLFLPSSWRLLRHPWFRQADVVQLFNTHGGYFSHSVLGVASRRKPFVWRMSDMWPMTGHCCYSYGCDRWKTGCGSCPLLDDDPALKTDRTAWLWRTKRHIYAKANVTLVAPSQWIAGLARQSPLVGHWPVQVIPNGLDLSVFRPISRTAAREVLGLPQEEQVVLFSSVETQAYRKGGTFMAEAVNRLRGKTSKPFRLLVVGNRAREWETTVGVPVTAIETVKDDHLLAALYSAADLFVHPALADNLPNGVLESLACATPVVAFDVGGVGEAVRSMETGYLARYKDAGDLAQGIARILDDADLRRRLSARCREVAQAEYDMALQIRRFEELYRAVMKDGRHVRDEPDRRPGCPA